MSQELRQGLVAAGRWMGERGLLPATAGNLSARLSADRALVTASGGDKGSLGAEDLLEIDLAAPIPAAASAETALHVALYRGWPEVNAVLHGHSPASTLVSLRLAGVGRLSLQGYELIKAFAGVKTHEAAVEVPIFANSQDLDGLAVKIAERLSAPPASGVWSPGLLLAGHGLYAWGVSLAAARRHLEALEFLLTCELEKLRSQP